MGARPDILTATGCSNPENRIIHMNMESLRYRNLLNYLDFYDYISEKIISGKKMYLIFDELQNVKGWEKAIESFRLDFDVDIYITGSNAYLLSSELATLLTGRYIEIKMLPISFQEYISAFEDKTDISKKFRNYLRYSSFPQSIELYKINPDNIDMFLDGIYNTVLMKDVVSRNNIKDVMILESVIKFLFDNIFNNSTFRS